MDIKTLLQGSPEDVVTRLKTKSVTIPAWDKLEKEYNPKKHPITSNSEYPDGTNEDGTVDKVARITQNMQKSAVKKTTQMCVGIPVKRVYSPENDKQKEVAKVIERIMKRNRIDDVNINRCHMLFAACEVFTLWYSVEEEKEHMLYKTKNPTKIKIKCKSYSPISGDSLYPLMDEYGDMLAMSFGSKKKEGEADVEYLDAYTCDTHVRYKNSGDGWILDGAQEKISIQKIPGVYFYRSEPVWEDTSCICYEIEGMLSRNAKYLRKNLKPVFGIFADEEVEETNDADKKSNDHDPLSVITFPKGSNAKYITWEQAIEGLKFHIQELRQSFFSQLQLPDTSFDSMKTTPMSGEARQMMFIDSLLKATEERGQLLAGFDREINVVKAFVKVIMPGYEDDIDALDVENIVTPFTIRSIKEDIENLVTANGGKAVMSQRESIAHAGYSDDVDKTMEELANEQITDIGEPSK